VTVGTEGTSKMQEQFWSDRKDEGYIRNAGQFLLLHTPRAPRNCHSRHPCRLSNFGVILRDGGMLGWTLYCKNGLFDLKKVLFAV